MRINLIYIPMYCIVFATGAAGLIYQVAWQKYLSRLLGSDSVATAIILAVFLGGLSFGYYLCGKFTTRVNNQFKAYALLEGIIGAWCLFFPNIFEAVQIHTQSWSFSVPIIIVVQGMLVSVLLMGIPTICMGGTIPFLTRGISRNLTEATNVHARVYAINTAGAFLGTLLAGFYLVPSYGLPLTIMGASSLNLGAFMFFYLISKSMKQTEPSQFGDTIDKTESRDTPALHRYTPSILYCIAFLSGLYVMTLENVLIRITNLSLGSSSYSFSIIVAVFILSIAVGSFVVGRLKQITRHFLWYNLFFITISLLAIYISLDTWPYWAHIIRIAFQSNMVGFWGYYGCVFLALAFILILPVGLMGATIPIAFHELKNDLKNVGKHSGLLFSWNTSGNLTGSLIGGIVCYYFLNNAGVFLTAVLIASLSTCLVGWHLAKRYFLPALFLSIGIFIFILFTPFYSEKNFMIGTFRIRTPFDYSLRGPKHFYQQFSAKKDTKLRFYKDGPTGTVAVIEGPINPTFKKNPMSIIINGKADSDTIGDIYTLKLLAHIPALLAENRKKVMVIGLGTGVTAGELTLYPDIERIDIAEISPTVVETLPYFQEFTHNINNDPRVHIHKGDAFRILGRSDTKWDIIISEPSNPWVTGVDLLFTREFYKLARKHLTENGILVQWAHTYSANLFMVGMILNTMQQELEPRVFLSRPGDLIIVASKKSLSIENLNKAEETLSINKKVKASLETINLKSLDSILIRELSTPSFINDFFSNFRIQTLDNPRLHYMAGKQVFIGKYVPIRLLLSSATAAYLQEFLMFKKYRNWMNYPFSRETFDSLSLSLRDKVHDVFLPMNNSLMLKAYLGNPDLFPLSEEKKKEFKVDILQFVTDRPKEEKDWAKVNLEGASFRKKATILLEHIGRFRNWIVPYPLDGLKALLKEGISSSKDVYERNWCTLKLALILTREKADTILIKTVLDQVVRGNDGRIILKEQDKILLETIKSLWRNSLKSPSFH